MSIIFTLIPIAILFVAIAIGLFFWAVRSDQFEDLDREGVNILFDEDESPSLRQNKSPSDPETQKTTPPQ